MKGLLIKDFINLKSQARVFVVMIVFYAVIGVTSKNPSTVMGLLMLMAVMLPITSLSYDEKAQWDKYALSMPVSRRDIVLSKYIMGIILLAASFVIATIGSLLISASSLQEILLANLGGAAFGALYLSLTLPVMFKLGVEKGRLLMVLLIFIPAALLVLILPKLNLSGISEEAVFSFFTVVLPLFILFALAVSIFVSLKIYKNKEL